MAQLITWDAASERFFEVGVDHGVLYPQESNGTYITGFAWNGLVSVSENPEGGEPTPLYADNIKYLNLYSAEDLNLTLEAFTYPDEFAVLDGSVEPVSGVFMSGQNRGVFGLSYRTMVGNDVDGNQHGYKLHLLYGCQATPSERAYSTINDSPEAITFSWDLSTIPASATGYLPTALIVIDSLKADATKLAALEVILYGDDGGPTQPRLPLPDEIVTLMTPV